MELNRLMKDFAAAVGLDSCTPDDNGVYGLLIDGMQVSAFETDRGCVALLADVGEPPLNGVEARERLYRTLLGAMHLGRGSASASFSINEETGMICLHRLEALATLDVEGFKEFLGHFVDALAEWRRIVVDFSPVAEKMAAEEGERRQTARDMAAGGFIQV